MGRILKPFLKGFVFGGFLATLFVFSPVNNQSGKVEGITSTQEEIAAEEQILPTPTLTLTPTLQPTPTSTPYPTPTTEAVPQPTLNNNDEVLLGLVNNYRQQQSFSLLEKTDSLCQYAEIRSQQIQSDFSHTQFQNDISSGVLFQTYCQGCKNVAENIAQGYGNESDALDSWINSPPHRANLEGNYNLGCGSSLGNYYVFVFGRK